MKFSDFKEGMIVTHPPVVVDEAEMLEFARLYDPQWFHTDPARAQEGRWGGLIASGWMTCGLAMRMAVNAALHDSGTFASPGLDELRWQRPVRAGDALRFEATVLSVRRSESRPELGIMRWTWRLYNQHNEQVLELTATNLFDLS
jgi:acyl dehydratase